jgi:hypothetical protein
MLDKLSIRQTKPKDTEELLHWWNDLFPEFQLEGPAGSAIRRFRDEELSPQQAGWAFEHWVCEAFVLQSSAELSVLGPMAIPADSSERPKEELDGFITTRKWQGFVIQCKLEKNPTSFDPIARLHLQVERRPVGTMGLFFARDYTDAAIELAHELRPIHVLLFTTVEINWALTRTPRLTMLDMVERKLRAAVIFAKPDYIISELAV